MEESFMISLPLFIFILLNVRNKINYAMWLFMRLFLKPSCNIDKMSDGNCGIKILWLCLIAWFVYIVGRYMLPTATKFNVKILTWSDYESASKWQRSTLAIHLPCNICNIFHNVKVLYFLCIMDTIDLLNIPTMVLIYFMCP